MPDPLLGQMENHPRPVVTVGRIEFIDNSVFVRLSAGSNLDVLIYKEGHRLDLCIFCLLVAFPAVVCLSDKLNMALYSRVFRQAGGQEDPRFRPEVLSLSLGGQVGCSRHHYLTQS